MENHTSDFAEVVGTPDNQMKQLSLVEPYERHSISMLERRRPSRVSFSGSFTETTVGDSDSSIVISSSHIKGLDFDEPGHVNSLTPSEARLMYLLWASLLDDQNSSSHTADLSGTVEEGISEEGEMMQMSSSALWDRNLWRGFLCMSRDADATILAFLRARKWDLQASKQMLQTTISWRSEMKIYDLVLRGESCLKRDLLVPGKSYFNGVDSADRLIFYVHARKHDKSAATSKEHQEFTIHFMELARDLSQPGAETATIVLDMQGSGYDNLDLGNVKFMVDVLQNHYPETLGKCFIVSAPWVFSAFWAMVKPLLDPVVASKIVFVNSSQELLDIIAEDTLLASLGGRNAFQYNFDVGLEDPSEMPGPCREHSQEETEQITYMELKFTETKTEFVDLTREIARHLEKIEDTDNDDSILDVMRQEKIQKCLHRRNYLKEKLWRINRKLRKLTEPSNLYHRLGVVDNAGAIHWEAAKK